MKLNSRKNKSMRKQCPKGYIMSDEGICKPKPEPLPIFSEGSGDTIINPDWDSSRACQGTCTLITGQSIGCQIHNAAAQSCMCDNAGTGQIVSFNCYWQDPPTCCNGMVDCTSQQFCNGSCECEEYPDNKCAYLRFSHVYDVYGSDLGWWGVELKWHDPDFEISDNCGQWDLVNEYANGCSNWNSSLFEAWISSCTASSWGNNYQCGDWAPGLYQGSGFSCHSCNDYIPSHQTQCPPGEWRKGGDIPKRSEGVKGNTRNTRVTGTGRGGKNPCPSCCVDPGQYTCSYTTDVDGWVYGSVSTSSCCGPATTGNCPNYQPGGGPVSGWSTHNCNCPQGTSCCGCPNDAQCQGTGCPDSDPPRCCDFSDSDGWCQAQNGGHPNWRCNDNIGGCSCKFWGGGSGGHSTQAPPPEWGRKGGKINRRPRFRKKY